MLVERKLHQTIQHLAQDSLSCQVPSFKHRSETFKPDCVLSCRSCSVCNFKRASERYKTCCDKERNKACQSCFFCKSMSLCPNCSKCPQCCQRAGCRGHTSEVLVEVGNTVSEHKGGLHFAGRLYPPIQNEWVTSLDFSDAYFHIPIHPRSRKYLRFFLNSKAYQFTALPFGLATAPLEFTKVVKEVKLMAQSRGIRIHQYLDNWLLRAPCPEIC